MVSFCNDSSVYIIFLCELESISTLSQSMFNGSNSEKS